MAENEIDNQRELNDAYAKSTKRTQLDLAQTWLFSPLGSLLCSRRENTAGFWGAALFLPCCICAQLAFVAGRFSPDPNDVHRRWELLRRVSDSIDYRLRPEYG